MIVKNAHRTKRTHHHNYTEQNAPQLHSPPVAPTTMELLHLRDKDWKQAKAYLVQTGREYYPTTPEKFFQIHSSFQTLFMIFCYTDTQIDKRTDRQTDAWTDWHTNSIQIPVWVLFFLPLTKRREQANFYFTLILKIGCSLVHGFDTHLIRKCVIWVFDL